MLFPSRASMIVSVVSALLLCQLPLLNVLGYESAAFFGVVGGLAALMNVNSAFRRGQLEGPASSSRTESPAIQAVRIILFQWILMLPPIFALCLNVIFVRNCDFLIGLAFWILIPMISIVLCVSLSYFAHSINRRWGATLCWLLIIGEFGYFLWRLAWEPPIAGISWLFGWFAGSIYDEALNLPSHVVWARIWTLFIAVAFLAWSNVAWRRAKGRGGGKSFFLIALALVMGIAIGSTSLMGMHTHESVQRALGGRTESAHFIIYYSKSALDKKDIRRLVEDAEYRYSELKDFFHEDPVKDSSEKMTLYVYGSVQQQYKLMGSRHTFVARPWTNQAHLRWRGYGDALLAHEMAHLFTAPFSKGPLAMPARFGFLIDTGMVEGIAVAADWPPDALNPHLSSAALRSLKMAPQMKKILSATGFWAQPSRRAYDMTGSFVRWLVDEYGIDAFKRVYANESWESAYGKTVEELAAEWQAFIDDIPVDDKTKALARYRYDKRSIFQKACARSIAELKRKVRVARKGGFYQQAADLQRRVLSYQPKDSKAILTLSAILIDSDQLDAASSVLSQLKESDLNPGLVARLREFRGDIAWLNGDSSAAHLAYDSCLTLGISDSNQRLLTSKIHGLQYGNSSAKAYLLGQSTPAMYLQKARAWSDENPRDPLPRYLVGLQLKSLGDYPSAYQWLSGPPLEQPVLDEERRRLLAETAHQLGLYDVSERVWKSLVISNSPRIAALAEEGLSRIRWRRAGDDWRLP